MRLEQSKSAQLLHFYFLTLPPCRVAASADRRAHPPGPWPESESAVACGMMRWLTQAGAISCNAILAGDMQ